MVVPESPGFPWCFRKVAFLSGIFPFPVSEALGLQGLNLCTGCWSHQGVARGGAWVPTLHMSVSQLSSPLSRKPWMMKRVFRSRWKFEASTVARSVAEIRWLN